MSEITEYKKNIKKITSVLKNFNPDEITLVVAGTGGGKSLLRKTVKGAALRKILNLTEEELAKENTTGLIGYFSIDTLIEFGLKLDYEPEIPTYVFIFEIIEYLVNKNEDYKYIIIECPEFGMSEEAQLGLCCYLNEKLRQMGRGAMIITSSTTIAESLNYDSFFSLDNKYKSLIEFISRDIIPLDLVKYKSQSKVMREFITKILKSE
jgi:hypothetical protein